MKPYTDLSSENRPRAARERMPHARWLASVSVVLAIITYPYEEDIEYMFYSVPVILAAMSICVAGAVLPLLLFVAINGRMALRHVRIRLFFVGLILSSRIIWDLFLVLIADILVPGSGPTTF